VSTADPGIQVTPDDVLKCRGISNHLDDMDLVYAQPPSPYAGRLVAVAMCDGVHVCWACGEPFDFDSSPERMIEKRVDGGEVPVGIHRKCFDPKNRKVFVDLKPTEPLPTVQQASDGLKLRRTVARAIKGSKKIVGG